MEVKGGEGGVVTSVWPSDRKVGDDLIEGKNSEFGCEITTERTLSTDFILWLVCLSNTHDK